jgi:eukaryotic-like serine/threonine-protein kinase
MKGKVGNMQLEGQQVGHYRLLSLLGSGGMGVVYLAEDLSVRRQVAIKVIRTESALYPDDIAAKEAANLFKREANAVAMLDHPNILPLFDYGEENLYGETLTYMVMPFRQEGSLADWLRRLNSFRRLSPQDVAFLIHQAASALQFAHDHHIIHRDVKPSNFLIRSRPENPIRPDLFLADFGIAKFSVANTNAATMLRGTPTYMPPEQWEDHPVLATDQYALAVLTYELLTGRPPFQGNHSQLMYQHFHAQPGPLSSINPQLASDIDMVVLRALAKKPNDRFPTIASFDQAFQQAVHNINNIHINLTINQMEAINGTSRTITLPDRRLITVAIPAGAYDGQIIQLEGQGKGSSYGDPAGSLVITIAISQIEKTVVSLHDSKTIGDTLPEFNIQHNQMPNNRHRGLSYGKIMILVLVLLLIVGSAGLFLVMARQNPFAPQPNTTATAQAISTATASTATSIARNTATAQANATATAQVQETASAVAGMTATAEVQASETPGVLQTAISVRPLLYQDALNNATNANTVAENWDQNPNCIFAPDGYHEKEDTNWHICGEGANTYQNVTITVNVHILNGQTGGLLFRASPASFDQYNGYLFEINDAGQYRISRVSPSIGSIGNPIIKPLQDWTTSPALLQGTSAINTLEVIAQGVTLYFYTNGVFLVLETDANYLSGDIAFYATTDGKTTADVVYSDLKVFPMS